VKKLLWLAVACVNILYASEDARLQQQEKDFSFIRKKLTTPSSLIKPLIGGLTSARLYEVYYDMGSQGPYIVRFLGGCSTKKEHKEIEVLVMQAADTALVGPQLFKTDTNNGENSYIFMQKINCMTPQEIPWKDAYTYTQLGSFLKRMHNQASDVPIDEHQSIYNRTMMFFNYIMNQCVGPDKLPSSNNYALFTRICKQILDIKEALPPSKRTVLVHGDLHPGNLLFVKDNAGALKSIVAIDWDQSRFHTDPYFDVALVYDLYVPKEFRECFMRAYSQELLSPKQNAHFRIMRSLSSCFFGLAYACSNPAYFEQKITEQKIPEKKVGASVRKIMHDGFARDTKLARATFGTLLFQKGYKPFNNNQLNTWINTLNNQ
jgi:Ser/Thr protein kinase RdoA (MazF antagonist)